MPAMRRVFLFVLVLLATTGCRTTHDATDTEVAQLGIVGGGLFSAQDASGDLGEGSAATTSNLHANFITLRKNADNGGGGGSTGLYIVDEGRAEWPECVTELDEDDGVEYDECEFAASGDGTSIEFHLDGFYHYSEGAADSNLAFDFGIAASGISVGWDSLWVSDLTWSDTVLDGEYHLDYVYGITTGNLPTLGGVELTVDGTIEELTWDDACPGLVSGVLDWTYTYKESGDPPENGHVTVEYTGCGSAEVTW
jgi:hypothetical protein